MQDDPAASHTVVGINVASSKKRTLQLKLLLENNEIISVELPLPTATRLTDQLIDMEFKERFPDCNRETLFALDAAPSADRDLAPLHPLVPLHP